MFEYINGWEWLPIALFTFIGFLMIQIVKRTDVPFMGVVVLGMIMFIAYSVHSNNQAKEFVLQRFSEGQSIECGLWRGESALIDSHNGWKHVPNLGFVKGDQIHNDPGICNVIAQEAPEPSVVSYGFAYMVLLAVSFLFRNVHKGDDDE